MKHKLHADSITKKYKGNFVLNNAMLQLETGEITGLFSRNGSGKSTLMRIIFGAVEADNKFVIIDNKDIESFTGEDKPIAYLPQHKYLPESMSVQKAIQLFITNKTGEFEADTFIGEIINRKISQLSGGEQRYLEAKLALYSPAKFVLLDEPFTELSPIVTEELKKEIIRCSEHKGILITDHKYLDVIEIANKLYLLKDGKTTVVDDAQELAKQGYLNSGT